MALHLLSHKTGGTGVNQIFIAPLNKKLYNLIVGIVCVYNLEG